MTQGGSIMVGRRVEKPLVDGLSTGHGDSSGPVPRQPAAVVRDWARANGYPVSDQGRISVQVEAAYRAAHGG